MHHILALAAPPGVFRAFGYKLPTVIGQLFHWIAADLFPWAVRSVKLLASLFIIFLMIRRGGSIWQLAFAAILGWLVLPGILPAKASSAVAGFTRGSSVGHTGASIGIIAILAFMVVFILILLPVLRRRSEADKPGGE
jgi:hypothetical protein